MRSVIKLSSFMLDSNIWEQIIEPEDFVLNKKYDIYQEINKKLFPLNGNTVFLSSMIFDLESIGRKDRIKELQKYEPQIEIEVCHDQDSHTTHFTFTIGPDHFPYKANPYLERRFQKAFEAGVHVVRNTRVGIPPINHMCDSALISFTEKQNSKMGEALDYIENELHAGFYAFNNILQNKKIKFSTNFLQIIRSIPPDSINQFASAVAEWADGDTLAIHIGMGFDYFVTDDKAKNAGTTSVFSQSNGTKLKNKYPLLRIITPEEMLGLL